MAKIAKSGDMRVQIMVQAPADGIDADGFQTVAWTDVFHGKKAWCKWINPHGTEIYEQMRLSLKEAVTITMRYTPLIDARCRIFKGYTPTGDLKEDDKHAYEIISIDNVEEENKLLEIKAQRKVKA